MTLTPHTPAGDSRVTAAARVRSHRPAVSSSPRAYQVSVGGTVVGEVTRVCEGGAWAAILTYQECEPADLGGRYARRMDAVNKLAGTVEAAVAYDTGAIQGAFGDAENRRVLASIDARIDAMLDVAFEGLDDNGQPLPAAPAAECERESVTPTDDGRMIVDCSVHGEIGAASTGGTVDRVADGEFEAVTALWEQHVIACATIPGPVIAGPLTLSDTVQRVCDDIRWTITSDEPVIVDGHSYRAKFVDVDEAYGAVQVLLVPAVPGAGHELWIDLAVMFEHQSLDVRRLGQLVADAMETPTRTAASLQEGDVFKLSGADDTWHVCAVNMSWGGSVAVYIDDQRDDEAPTVRVDAAADAPVIVAVPR